MRLLRVLPAVVLCACGKAGQIVHCDQSWICPGNIENIVGTDADEFCTDPDAPDRDQQMIKYQQDFEQTCGGVPIGCGGDVEARCAASCAPAGECDINKLQEIRLR